MFPNSINSLSHLPIQTMQPIKDEVNVFEESWKEHNMNNFNQLYPHQVDLQGELVSGTDSH